MIRNVNDHDNPLILKPEDYSLDELDKIVGNFSSMQCGYTLMGDCIQFLSEQLDIPENIADYLIRQYRRLENCRQLNLNYLNRIEKEG